MSSSARGLALSVRDVSKSYMISHNPTGRDRDGDNPRRHLVPSFRRQTKETFWALKDVSFEVRKGEMVGIIGRNGAGKSTLLKILSRITHPTRGDIDVFGRVGSLLEVGTGFHPELTGRENIFLNGTILGMRRREVQTRFDSIVDFAGVERFLDTPVKRYSSGMYVRLAFAVAAHLDPEILIVDEVLAVGDAAFQQKCLGKMRDVAYGGRTVLFVSHNMAAVRSLCSRGLLFDDGFLSIDSDIDAVTAAYMGNITSGDANIEWSEATAPQSETLRFLRASIGTERDGVKSRLDNRESFLITVEYEVLQAVDHLRIGFSLRNEQGIEICGSNDPHAWPTTTRQPGRYVSQCRFPGNLLNAGEYAVRVAADSYPYREPLATSNYCLTFSVEELAGHGLHYERLPGVIRPQLEWTVTKISDSPYTPP